MTVEEHPLKPFLPKNARMLFLGSFPPPKARWSMEFFYPNWINDFWRIIGLLFYNDKSYFECEHQSFLDGNDIVQMPKKFDRERIIEFCKSNGLAFFDTALKVCRLKDNADDNFLEIIDGTDVLALLEQIPGCRTVVTTGGKASDELLTYFIKKSASVKERNTKLKIPKVGECIDLCFPSYLRFNLPFLKWYRMPSSSRAYPMKLERKAELYSRLFE